MATRGAVMCTQSVLILDRVLDSTLLWERMIDVTRPGGVGWSGFANKVFYTDNSENDP